MQACQNTSTTQHIIFALGWDGAEVGEGSELAVAVRGAVTVTVVVWWGWGAWRSRRVRLLLGLRQKLLRVLRIHARIVGALLPQALELDRRLRLALRRVLAAPQPLTQSRQRGREVHIVTERARGRRRRGGART